MSEPTSVLYFEDFLVGDRRMLGSRQVTLEAIRRFASEFDPLPIHLDAEAARRSIHGGLIASGLHTLCIVASVVVDEVLTGTAMSGAAGMTDTRCLRPVRPGDWLSVVFTVVEVEPWPGRTDIGRVRARLDASNQDEKQVLTTLVDYLFLRRDVATLSSRDANGRHHGDESGSSSGLSRGVLPGGDQNRHGDQDRTLPQGA